MKETHLEIWEPKSKRGTLIGTMLSRYPAGVVFYSQIKHFKKNHLLLPLKVPPMLSSQCLNLFHILNTFSQPAMDMFKSMHK